MIVLSFFLILSALFLDGLVSLWIPNFFSNFTFLTLILVYPFFKKKKLLYLCFLVFFSVCYDVVYTNLLFFNTVLYFVLFLLWEKNFKFLKVGTVIGFYFLYHILEFSLLYVVGYTSRLMLLPMAILKHLVLSGCYVFIFFLVFRKKYSNFGREGLSIFSSSIS